MVEIEFQPENNSERNAISNYEAGVASDDEKDLREDYLSLALGKNVSVAICEAEGEFVYCDGFHVITLFDCSCFFW